jgi:hypothetical protein
LNNLLSIIRLRKYKYNIMAATAAEEALKSNYRYNMIFNNTSANNDDDDVKFNTNLISDFDLQNFDPKRYEYYVNLLKAFNNDPDTLTKLLNKYNSIKTLKGKERKIIREISDYVNKLKDIESNVPVAAVQTGGGDNRELKDKKERAHKLFKNVEKLSCSDKEFNAAIDIFKTDILRFKDGLKIDENKETYSNNNPIILSFEGNVDTFNNAIKYYNNQNGGMALKDILIDTVKKDAPGVPPADDEQPFGLLTILRSVNTGANAATAATAAKKKINLIKEANRLVEEAYKLIKDTQNANNNMITKINDDNVGFERILLDELGEGEKRNKEATEKENKENMEKERKAKKQKEEGIFSIELNNLKAKAATERKTQTPTNAKNKEEGKRQGDREEEARRREGEGEARRREGEARRREGEGEARRREGEGEGEARRREGEGEARRREGEEEARRREGEGEGEGEARRREGEARRREGEEEEDEEARRREGEEEEDEEELGRGQPNDRRTGNDTGFVRSFLKYKLQEPPQIEGNDMNMLSNLTRTPETSIERKLNDAENEQVSLDKAAKEKEREKNEAKLKAERLEKLAKLKKLKRRPSLQGNGISDDLFNNLQNELAKGKGRRLTTPPAERRKLVEQTVAKITPEQELLVEPMQPAKGIINTGEIFYGGAGDEYNDDTLKARYLDARPQRYSRITLGDPKIDDLRVANKENRERGGEDTGAVKTDNKIEQLSNEIDVYNGLSSADKDDPIKNDEMIQKIKRFEDDPKNPLEELELTFDDRIVFIIATFFVRYITIIMVQWCIDINIIKTFYEGFIYYAVIYIILFWFIVLFINIDNSFDVKYMNFNGIINSIRTLFYYFYMGTNGISRLLIHTSLILLLIVIPIILNIKKSNEYKPDDEGSSDSVKILDFDERKQLSKALSLFTMFIWLFTSIIATKF